MNKTAIISITGIVLVVAGIAIWQIVKKPAVTVVSNTEPSTTSVSTATTPSPTSGKKIAFSEFVKKGGSYECTVDQYIGGNYSVKTEGKVFLSNGNIRGDYSVKAQGMDIKGSVIVRDGYAYTWSSMMSQGYKVAVKDTAGTVNTGSAGAYSWNADQIGDYNCIEWKADASKFVVPTSITFKEIVSQ